MNRLLIALTITAAAISANAQNTQKLTANKLNEYGLIYTLPKTAVYVTIEAEKTVKQPGEFFRYAKKYLGINPITEPSTTYRLGSITLWSHGIADEKEQYLAQFKSGSTPFIIINDNNCPLSVNNEKEIIDVVFTLPQPVAAQPTILQTPAATQAMTAEMLQSQSSAKRAELAAARIFEIRQSRSEIISGTAENMPTDGQAMQLALDNLNAQETALTAMFAGTTQTSTQVETFSITLPEGNDNHWETVVARLSVLDGIVDSGNLSGDPIKLTLDVTSRGQLPKNDKGEEKRFPKGGLAYRIPGSADVAVSFMGQKVASKSIDVAQYGVVFGLEPNLFTDKKAPAYAIFNPTTGAIVEIGTKQED